MRARCNFYAAALHFVIVLARFETAIQYNENSHLQTAFHVGVTSPETADIPSHNSVAIRRCHHIVSWLIDSDAGDKGSGVTVKVLYTTKLQNFSTVTDLQSCLSGTFPTQTGRQ
jgi:hypothetical protein